MRSGSRSSLLVTFGLAHVHRLRLGYAAVAAERDANRLRSLKRPGVSGLDIEADHGSVRSMHSPGAAEEESGRLSAGR